MAATLEQIPIRQNPPDRMKALARTKELEAVP
jgi:hypothetical protein